ncbi:MAG: hypothetical protein Q8R82_22980 [Hyphomonadaceae bacterium]|nr:hypothetical protein [Hyphomonadaceae bacterium]
MQNRRDFLARSAACAALTAAGAGPSFAQDTPLEFDDDLFLAVLGEQSADDNPLLKRGPSEATALGRKIKKILSAEMPERSIIWAPEVQLSPDYRHLGAARADGSFTLTHEVMERLCAANSFAPVAAATNTAKASGRDGAVGSTKILIGLRGCIADGTTSGASIKLKVATPDHINLKCMIGVWDTEAKSFTVFPGSTVPDQGYVLAQTLDVDKIPERLPTQIGACSVARKNLTSFGFANMVPTGQFIYVVGTHNLKWKPPELRSPKQVASAGMRDVRQPAAFRQASIYPTLRVLTSNKDVFYSTDAYWDMDARSWGVNIHAAYKPKTHWKFDSAGCQVVRGYYTVLDDPTGKGKPAIEAGGDYAQFRIAAGLSAVPTFVKTPETWADSLATTDDGKLFYSYLLVTGQELAAHAAATTPTAQQSLKRLRFGSTGPRVTELCRALTAAGFRTKAETSEFDHSVACDLLRWQVCNGGADGIVTPSIAAELKMSI